VSDRIEVRELRCLALVGVLAEERERLQPIVFDIDLDRAFDVAARTDDLAATTNYAAVVALAVRVTREGHVHLLETLAHRVADEILRFDTAISSVTVAVRKTRPPVPEDVATVGVRCTVNRA